MPPVQWFTHSICFHNICFLIGFNSYWLFLAAIKPHKVAIDKGIIITEVKVAILNSFFKLWIGPLIFPMWHLTWLIVEVNRKTWFSSKKLTLHATFLGIQLIYQEESFCTMKVMVSMYYSFDGKYFKLKQATHKLHKHKYALSHKPAFAHP